MAVPRSSAPVFGRYAGVQGVQSWHSCVGAPPDAGFGPIFRSVRVCRSAARRGLRPLSARLLECYWSVTGVTEVLLKCH